MVAKPIPIEPEYLACEICLAEIPESVGSCQEADDYAQHYCGIECYAIWKSASNTEKEHD